MQPSELADAAPAASGNPPQRGLNGGRFDFDDGGTYCGDWDDGKAHGHGVCTGPKGQGAYAGSWHFGFEVSGVYTWPRLQIESPILSSTDTQSNDGSSYEGQWQNGKRHGLGVETRGRWLYRGEWTQGYKGRYGVRQSTTSNAKYEGTWANGLQDGYGSETYADGGTYQGQWQRGMRYGYGVRTSAPFGLASHYRGGARDHRGSVSSLAEAGTPDPTEGRTHRLDEARGGFVLKSNSDEPTARRGSLVEKTKKGLLSKLRKQRSAGELDKRGASSVRSGGSGGSGSSWVSSVDSTHSAMTHGSLHTDSNASFLVEDEHLEAGVTEVYMGEWKSDKRNAFGVSERSDGLRYEGEWCGNKKNGYGVTTFRDGTSEQGKYKNNVLITSQKRRHMFLMRSAKFRERVESAVAAAQRAAKIAVQKSDIAISRTATARGKAEQADEFADQAKEDCELAQMTAKQFATDFKHPGLDKIGLRDKYRQKPYDSQVTTPVSQESEKILEGKSIPNHIPPMHQQIPQANKVPYGVPPRRLSTQFPNKQTQPLDPRLTNSSNYNTDDRAGYYNSNQDNWQNTQSQGQQYAQSDQIGGYGPSGPPGPPSSHRVLNRQDAVQQPSGMDQSSQQFANQGRRISSAVRPALNLNQRQQWNSSQEPGNRRQSILGQPSQYVQEATYADAGGANYGRNELRTGTVHSEGQHDRPGGDPMHHHQPTEPQGYQQPLDHRQQRENSMYRQAGADQSMYRQTAPEYDATNGPNQRQPGRTSIDYFDHYKRPPSRDSSVDRYGRRSRQPSAEPSAPARDSRAGSVAPPAPTAPRAAAPSAPAASRGATPAPGNGHLASGRGSVSRETPFEESLMRKRNLGQDISPSPYQPKRTESLCMAPAPAPPPPVIRGGGGGGGGGSGGRKMLSTPQTLQRKKSLPDVAGMPMTPNSAMSREEVSMLGSARREEVRRMHEETEKLRANPLLYLVSPQVKDWFSRQQLVILVLFINISLGIMFFKLLT